jgi:hypothetical protein
MAAGLLLEMVLWQTHFVGARFFGSTVSFFGAAVCTTFMFMMDSTRISTAGAFVFAR